VTRCLHTVEVMRSRNEHITARFASRFHRGARKDRKTETNSYGSMVRVSLPDDLFTIYVRSDLLTFYHFFWKTWCLGRAILWHCQPVSCNFPCITPSFPFTLAFRHYLHLWFASDASVRRSTYRSKSGDVGFGVVETRGTEPPTAAPGKA
jgi:hypothetical protein